MSESPLLINNSTDENPVDSNKVILEVGLPGDTWQYLVDRQTLAGKLEWFRALLTGGMAPPPSNPLPVITLNHFDKRAFDQLLRFLNGKPVAFDSVETARASLDVAHSCLCPGLAKLSVDYMIKHMNATTVLQIYHGLRFYVDESENSIIENVSNHSPNDINNCAKEIGEACSRLFSACLAVIDTTPEDVLLQECFEELSVEEISNVAGRDDLRLTKESILFKSLDKWSTCECRRRGIEPTPINKRKVLADDIWFSVRYLLMDDKEFIQGPMSSGILSSEESAIIIAQILDHNSSNKLNKKNINLNVNKNKNNQLLLINNDDDDNCQSNVLFKLTNIPRKDKSSDKSMKPGKTERDDNKKNRRKECASQGQKACSRFGHFIIHILACIFD